jgi:hypothetical protein
MSYAVVWREDSGPRNVGKLELEPDCVHLVGFGELRISYGDLVGLRVQRHQGGFLSRRPILVLVDCAGRTVELLPLQGVGALYELADQLADACGKAAA